MFNTLIITVVPSVPPAYCSNKSAITATFFFQRADTVLFSLVLCHQIFSKSFWKIRYMTTWWHVPLWMSFISRWMLDISIPTACERLLFNSFTTWETKRCVSKRGYTRPERTGMLILQIPRHAHTHADKTFNNWLETKGRHITLLCLFTSVGGKLKTICPQT